MDFILGSFFFPDTERKGRAGIGDTNRERWECEEIGYEC